MRTDADVRSVSRGRASMPCLDVWLCQQVTSWSPWPGAGHGLHELDDRGGAARLRGGGLCRQLQQAAGSVGEVCLERVALLEQDLVQHLLAHHHLQNGWAQTHACYCCSGVRCLALCSSNMSVPAGSSARFKAWSQVLGIHERRCGRRQLAALADQKQQKYHTALELDMHSEICELADVDIVAGARILALKCPFDAYWGLGGRSIGNMPEDGAFDAQPADGMHDVVSIALMRPNGTALRELGAGVSAPLGGALVVVDVENSTASSMTAMSNVCTPSALGAVGEPVRLLQVQRFDSLVEALRMSQEQARAPIMGTAIKPLSSPNTWGYVCKVDVMKARCRLMHVCAVSVDEHSVKHKPNTASCSTSHLHPHSSLNSILEL